MRLLLAAVLALVAMACEKTIHEVRAPAPDSALVANHAPADRPM